jgi:Peptidase family M20/M25/M40
MATETSVLADLEPRSFWGHFEALTRIPRPSRHEEPVIEHVREWADRHGFELEQDSGRNLVIRVPATRGRESAPVLILQGHLDMVCERDPTSPNDPAEGRIALARDGDWLTADGTTLGADDGVAIAAMVALVEDESRAHGPLELLMTVAEEVGLEGALERGQGARACAARGAFRGAFPARLARRWEEPQRDSPRRGGGRLGRVRRRPGVQSSARDGRRDDSRRLREDRPWSLEGGRPS